ncbi:hypothetical protein CSAL01_13775, partial [Colletotrichum salicis]
ELIDKIDKLAKTQPTEGSNERKVGYLCTAVQRVPEARMTLHAPPADYETLCSRLRASFSIEARMPKQQQFRAVDGPYQQHWVDRTYNGKGKEARYGNRYNGQERRAGSAANAGFKPRGSQPRGKCWICKKDGCWSTSHTQEERDRSYEKFKQLKGTEGKNNPRQYQQFLVDYEGIDPSTTNE